MSGQITFLLDLGILTVFALVFSIIFARFKLSPVSGQILAGMLLGPSVFGLVTDPVILNEISTVGVVLLLFVIGLGLDPLQLRKIAGKVVSLTLLEVGIAFGFGLLASVVLKLNFVESLILSMSAAVTSTAVVGKAFLDRRPSRKDTEFLIGLLVVEDIMAVVFLVTLSSIASGSGSSGMFAILEVAVGGLALIVLAYGVARYIAPPIINYLSYFEEEFEEIPFLFALGLGFLFGVLGAYFGYSPGVGAFIIGLSIRGKHSKFLSSKIGTIKDLFLILFFVSMGSYIDPFPAFGIGAAVVLTIAILISGKFFAGAAIGKIISTGTSEIDQPNSLGSKSMGAWLVPRGEFSFVIGQLGLALSLINGTIFSIIGLTVLLSTIAWSILERVYQPKKASSVYLFKGRADDT
jgi:monovalent cation:H+ antiporter-2, CPA2 family